MEEILRTARWSVLTCIVFVCVLSVTNAAAQSGNSGPEMKSRVLDILFSRDTPNLYFEKVVLRFWDTNTQIIIVVYPAYPPHAGGQAEIIRYSLVGTNGGELERTISNMEKSNPHITAEEIAVKLNVDVSRSSVDYNKLDQWLKKLRSTKISPALQTRVGVDDVSIYEFWYDTGEESVHYTIFDPSGNDHQDKLGRWMEEFRKNLPKLLKASSQQTH